MKAVAPTGTESVTIVIPEAENQVSLLGEKLIVERADGTATYSSDGRPIAIVSNSDPPVVMKLIAIAPSMNPS